MYFAHSNFNITRTIFTQNELVGSGLEVSMWYNYEEAVSAELHQLEGKGRVPTEESWGLDMSTLLVQQLWIKS